MSRALALLACAALTCSGCAAVGKDALLSGGSTNTDDSRLIIVTVDNERPAAVPRPGTTPRAYSGTDIYMASDAARSTMRNLARQ